MASVNNDIEELSHTMLDNFFLTMEGGFPSSAFLIAWGDFQQLVETRRDDLTKETLSLVLTLADTIGSLASDILQLANIGDRIHHETEAEVAQLLKEMDLERTPLACPPPPGKGLLLPYIHEAYAWLLDNLHNPYPSKESRLKISRDANSAAKDIDAWFIDARRRIGWNELRRKTFSNKKDLIIKAATQFFKPDPEALEIDFLRYNTHFASIHANAQNLYPHKATKKLSEKTTSVADPLHTTIAALQYPSPSPSPNRSPVPLPSCLKTQSRKRKISPDYIDNADTLPLKRSRFFVDTISPSLAASSLPSPPVSCPDLEGSEDDIKSPESSTLVEIFKDSTPSRKRKRCVSEFESDSECHSRWKRSQYLDVSIPPPFPVGGSPMDEIPERYPILSAKLPDPVSAVAFDEKTFFDISVYESNLDSLDWNFFSDPSIETITFPTNSQVINNQLQLDSTLGLFDDPSLAALGFNKGFGDNFPVQNIPLPSVFDWFSMFDASDCNMMPGDPVFGIGYKGQQMREDILRLGVEC